MDILVITQNIIFLFCANNKNTCIFGYNYFSDILFDISIKFQKFWLKLLMFTKFHFENLIKSPQHNCYSINDYHTKRR